MLRASEGNDDGPIGTGGGGSASRDEDADVAGGAFQNGCQLAAEPCADVAKGVDDDEVDVLFGGDSHDVVARRRRHEGGGADGSSVLGQQLHPLVSEAGCVGEPLAVSLEHDEDQLSPRMRGERLGYDEQCVERLGALGGDENRTR